MSGTSELGHAAKSLIEHLKLLTSKQKEYVQLCHQGKLPAWIDALPCQQIPIVCRAKAKVKDYGELWSEVMKQPEGYGIKCDLLPPNLHTYMCRPMSKLLRSKSSVVDEILFPREQDLESSASLQDFFGKIGTDEVVVASREGTLVNFGTFTCKVRCMEITAVKCCMSYRWASADEMGFPRNTSHYIQLCLTKTDHIWVDVIDHANLENRRTRVLYTMSNLYRNARVLMPDLVMFGPQFIATHVRTRVWCYAEQEGFSDQQWDGLVRRAICVQERARAYDLCECSVEEDRPWAFFGVKYDALAISMFFNQVALEEVKSGKSAAEIAYNGTRPGTRNVLGLRCDGVLLRGASNTADSENGLEDVLQPTYKREVELRTSVKKYGDLCSGKSFRDGNAMSNWFSGYWRIWVIWLVLTAVWAILIGCGYENCKNIPYQAQDPWCVEGTPQCTRNLTDAVWEAQSSISVMKSNLRLASIILGAALGALLGCFFATYQYSGGFDEDKVAMFVCLIFLTTVLVVPLGVCSLENYTCYGLDPSFLGAQCYSGSLECVNLTAFHTDQEIKMAEQKGRYKIAGFVLLGITTAPLIIMCIVWLGLLCIWSIMKTRLRHLRHQKRVAPMTDEERMETSYLVLKENDDLIHHWSRQDVINALESMLQNPEEMDN